MDESLDPPIALGRTAEIYAWHDGQVLKLFYAWFGLENIELEARNPRAAHACGIPSPVVGEILQVGGRYGLEYERIDGIPMFKEFQHKPWNVLHYAKQWAELHAQLHDCTLPGEFPSQRKTLEKNIQQAEALPASLRSKTLAALDALPDGDRICHGDFWPNNILMAAKGEMIIEWFRARRGNPLADLAWTTNLMLGFTRTSQVKKPFLSYGATKTGSLKNCMIQIFCRFSYPVYLNEYFRIRPGGEAEYHRWLPVMAATRLSDNIPELEKMLLGQVKKYLT